MAAIVSPHFQAKTKALMKATIVLESADTAPKEKKKAKEKTAAAPQVAQKTAVSACFSLLFSTSLILLPAVANAQ